MTKNLTTEVAGTVMCKSVYDQRTVDASQM